MTTLAFPESVEAMAAAFDSALARGAMQRERRDLPSFFLRFEYLVSDAENGRVTHDWFCNTDTREYIRVPRTEVPT